MKKLKLLTIKLNDFANWKKCEIDFEKTKNLVAPYGYGKTTIYNAFLWCLGLEVSGEVAPTNENLLIEEGVISKVELHIQVDEFEHTLVRQSNNRFEINGNKITTLKKYVEEITSLLDFDIQYLNLLMKSGTFNYDTSKWKWNNRRDFLTNLFKVDELLQELKQQYPLLANDFRTKKENEIESSFITETKNLNKLKQTANENLMKKIEQLQQFSSEKEQEIRTKISELENTIKSAKENDSLILVENKKEAIKNFERETQLETNRLKDNVSKPQYKLDMAKANLEEYKITCHNDLTKLYENIQKVDKLGKECLNRQFTPETICKYCGSPINPTEIEKNKEKFQQAKQEEFNNLKMQYGKLVGEYKQIQESVAKREQEVKELEESIKLEIDYNENILNTFLDDVENTRKRLNEELSEMQKNCTLNINDLEQELRNLYFELGEYKAKEVLEIEVEELRKSIKQATAKEQELAKKKVQWKEYLEKSIDIVNNTINSQFKEGISFKLFNKKTDGTYEQECITLLDGKPYDNLSFGERILTDFLLVKYLQNKFEVKLPIFIDNANAFTEINENEYQVISLITSINQEPNFKGIKLSEYYEKKGE